LTGAHAKNECRKAAIRICRRINHAVYGNSESKALKLRPEFYVHRFTIQNIVVTFRITCQLKLDVWYSEWNKSSKMFLESKETKHPMNMKLKRITYAPEKFPGLRLHYTTMNGKRKGIICLIFNNGKCVVTGFQSEENAEIFSRELYNIAIVYSK